MSRKRNTSCTNFDIQLRHEHSSCRDMVFDFGVRLQSSVWEFPSSVRPFSTVFCSPCSRLQVFGASSFFHINHPTPACTHTTHYVTCEITRISSSATIPETTPSPVIAS
ncbi:hypothetical protein RvY_04399 [Ramazzottius varieornatus]|uniref:Uncharacterized protein n=1 Tax=Ramazzottius varieornatus TaxID=947166 RepID=A0A1D1US80_RAMVA|nr:hypothetical protein RvY_04399 [Ramazzottius varieornatus]